MREFQKVSKEVVTANQKQCYKVI